MGIQPVTPPRAEIIGANGTYPFASFDLKDEDIERELNRSGLTFMHPEYKTNAEQNLGFFDSLIGMAADSVKYGNTAAAVAAEYMDPKSTAELGENVRTSFSGKRQRHPHRMPTAEEMLRKMGR